MSARERSQLLPQPAQWTRTVLLTGNSKALSQAIAIRLNSGEVVAADKRAYMQRVSISRAIGVYIICVSALCAWRAKVRYTVGLETENNSARSLIE